MPDTPTRATASARRPIHVLVMAMLAASLAVSGLAFAPQPVQATQKKVVIVVGPVGANTSYFKRVGDEAAQAARAVGAKVVKIYSPYATWERVKSAARGANVFVYIGHGNGWPSPYKPFQTRTKNGIGVNSAYGRGNNNHKYYGERYMDGELGLAKGAVVILMRTCYAAGASERRHGIPTKSVAMQRVDNYGAGFLRGGASAVFAEIHGNARYIFNGLFYSNKTMAEIFWSAPNRTGSYKITFSGTRSIGRAIMDPRKPGAYYRSVVGKLDMKASAWR